MALIPTALTPGEWTRDEFRITTDPTQIDLDVVCALLAESYWAADRPMETIRRSLEGSIPFGLFHGAHQVGLARVVTDCATFAWLCDVVIAAEYRGCGLGKWLIAVVMAHPELATIRLWMLCTRDAHGLYEQSGFRLLGKPEYWMSRLREE